MTLVSTSPLSPKGKVPKDLVNGAAGRLITLLAQFAPAEEKSPDSPKCPALLDWASVMSSGMLGDKFSHAGRDSGKQASGLSVTRYQPHFQSDCRDSPEHSPEFCKGKERPRQRKPRMRTCVPGSGLLLAHWLASRTSFPDPPELLFSFTKFLLLSPGSKQQSHPIPRESYPVPHTISVWGPYVSLFTSCAHQGDHQTQSLLCVSSVSVVCLLWISNVIKW